MTNAVVNWIQSWHLGLALIIFFGVAVAFSMFQPAPAQTPLNGAAADVINKCYEDFLGQKPNEIGDSADVCDSAMHFMKKICDSPAVSKYFSACELPNFKAYIKGAGL